MTPLEHDWERYQAEQKTWARVAKLVGERVMGLAATSGIPCHVTHREKTLPEFAKKAVRKSVEQPRYLTHPWEMITDKAGARAIVHRLSDVDRLADAIRADSSLQVVDESDTRPIDPKTLDYGGLHLQILAPLLEGETGRRECEVQLRTAAQDLWSSVVSHRFLYKPLVELPPELERSLRRLVALMEIFDAEVERAMNQIAAIPEYRSMALLDAAEQEYLSIVPAAAYDRSLSRVVIDGLLPCISEEDLDGYPERLKGFVIDHLDELRIVLGDYGHSDDFRYILLTQPEITIFFELLLRDATRLSDVWAAAGFPEDLLLSTSAALGHAIE